MFAFSDQQQMVRQMVRRWVEAKLMPANDALESGQVLPYALMRDFAKTFALADLVEAAFERMESKSDEGDGAKQGTGTLGGDPAMQAIIAIEMSRANPGFFMSFAATLGLAGGAIMAKGTLEQKKRWALPILKMDKIGAWGMTEPGAGSDAFGSMRTMARPDGDDFVLNGQKTFITNAPFADICVVYAKIDDGSDVPMRTRPIHAFVVEKGMPGFDQPKPMRKMGMHTSPTGELFLQDVRVPRSNLLGERAEAQARSKAKSVFHGERTGMAPMALGIIERCLEVCVPYALQRKTWDRPIAEYQLVQEKLARMFVHKQNAENMLFKQLWLQKEGKSMNEAEASATKLYCARAATECALEAVQILGGNGYMAEYHVEQLARDAKLLQIGGGTDEIQIGTIARYLFDDTRAAR